MNEHMKETNKIKFSNRKHLLSIIKEEADKGDPYDCYEFEHTMNTLQPYLSSLTEEQQKQIETIQKHMIHKNISPRKIREHIINKLQKYNIYIPTKDEILKNKIQKINQQLHFFQQLKELRKLRYNWEDIHYLITEEIRQNLLEDQQNKNIPFLKSFENEYFDQFYGDTIVNH